MIKINIRFLTLALFVFLLAGCGGGSDPENTDNSSNGEESNKTTISLAHSVAEDSAYQMFAEKFKEIVEEETDGEISVQIHPAGSLGGERELVEGIGVGTIDSAIVSTGPIGNFTNLSEIMDFPFLFNDSEHAQRVLDGEIGDEIGAEMEKEGINLMAWLEGGFANTTNSVRPIKEPKDFEGLSIRAQENDIHIATFEALGANPTPMAFTEVFTSLQQGVIDGQTNMLATIVPSKLYESQDYYTHNEIYYISAPFLMGTEVFESFSSENQDIIMDASISARDEEREFVADMEDEYLETIKDNGLEVIMQDELDMDEFISSVQSVYDDYDEEFGPYFEKIKALED